MIRVDPHVLLQQSIDHGVPLVPFSVAGPDWDGDLLHEPQTFVTAIGAGTTYPDYKPAPFIVASQVHGVDMVTVVTEGIFSYCGVKVKIDTDRHLGPECAVVRAGAKRSATSPPANTARRCCRSAASTTSPAGRKKEGRVTCDTLLALCNGGAVELAIDEGASVLVQAGQAPVVNGVAEDRMRVGCGSATIGMFARQWEGKVDEVIVVDDHITGVLSEHQAGKLLGMRETGMRIKGRRSTPGRYFQVAEPGTGWGGTDISDPLSILGAFDPKSARAGPALLMVIHHRRACRLLRAGRRRCARSSATCPPPSAAPSLASGRIASPRSAPCCSWAAPAASLRAGVTENPVRLTRSVKDRLTTVTCGGAPVYVWPGGGITFMVDVTRMPAGASATCRHPRSWRRSSSPCAATTTTPSAATWATSAVSTGSPGGQRRVVQPRRRNPWPLRP